MGQILDFETFAGKRTFDNVIKNTLLNIFPRISIDGGVTK
jgi:hypothetical protein